MKRKLIVAAGCLLLPILIELAAMAVGFMLGLVQ